jgi:hypothetical protein
MAVKPVAYHHNYGDRLKWTKLPGKDWWLVAFKDSGKVFAEMWKGKSGLWFGLIYTAGKREDGTVFESAKRFADASGRWVYLTICGAVTNRKT